MTLMVALAGALGLLLIYDGCVRRSKAPTGGWATALDELAAESGVDGLSGTKLVAAVAAAAVTSFMLVAGITSSGVIAAAISAPLAWLPIGIVRGRRQSRRRRFREAWPDAIATLIASVRAGVSLPESCASLVDRGPSDLQPSFESFASTYRATGSFAAGLDRLRQQTADPIGDRVVAALSLAHEVGGTDLIRVLRTLGDFVREDLRVRKEIEARWSWTVTAARVAAGAPWVVLLLMATHPEAAAAYDSPTGAIVIAAGTGATFLGYRLMLRAGRLPEDRRLSL